MPPCCRRQITGDCHVQPCPLKCPWADTVTRNWFNAQVRCYNSFLFLKASTGGGNKTKTKTFFFFFNIIVFNCLCYIQSYLAIFWGDKCSKFYLSDAIILIYNCFSILLSALYHLFPLYPPVKEDPSKHIYIAIKSVL